MTPEQKERIQKAAREMEAALNEVRGHLDISINATNATAFGDRGRRYVYQINVINRTEEVIA